MSSKLIANGDRVRTTEEHLRSGIGSPFTGVVLWINANENDLGRLNRIATVLLESGDRKIISVDWLERSI